MSEVSALPKKKALRVAAATFTKPELSKEMAAWVPEKKPEHLGIWEDGMAPGIKEKGTVLSLG